MYSGPGPGPLLAAATAWDDLAGELSSAASSYDATIAGILSGAWSGPSSEAMAAAATPYIAWLGGTAAQAELAAGQIRAAVAAYETAFSATVPPPVVTANRSLLATLVATNFLGMNTPAIAATEFHYAEMWAQDAAAMYAYAGASFTATQLAAFSPPPQTTNEGGLAAQSAATAQSVGTSAGTGVQSALSQMTMPGTLQAASTAGTTTTSPSWLESVLSSTSTIASNLTGAYSPVGLAGIPGGWWLTATQILGLAQNVPGVNALLAGPKPIVGGLGPLSGGYISLQSPALVSAGSGASGTIGGAGLVGGLSVPTNWAAAVPAANTAAVAMPSAGLSAAPAIVSGGQSSAFTEMALSSLAGRALSGTAARTVVQSSGRVVGATVTALDAADDPTTVNIIVIPPED